MEFQIQMKQLELASQNNNNNNSTLKGKTVTAIRDLSTKITTVKCQGKKGRGVPHLSCQGLARGSK